MTWSAGHVHAPSAIPSELGVREDNRGLHPPTLICLSLCRTPGCQTIKFLCLVKQRESVLALLFAERIVPALPLHKPTFRYASAAMAMSCTPAANVHRLLRPSISRASMLDRQNTLSRTVANFSSQSRLFGFAACASGFHLQRKYQNVQDPTSRQTIERHPNITSVARRTFSATAARPKDHHFDTLKFVQRLKDEGLTEEQAVAMMKVLGDVIEERYVKPFHGEAIPPAASYSCFFLGG